MKKITLAIIALVLASLVFVLSGCEMSLNLKKDDTQSHTVIVEITDDNGVVIATEAVTLSEDEIKKGETFFDKEDDEDTTVKTGVSADRLQQAVSQNKNNSSTTVPAGDSTGKKPGNSGSAGNSNNPGNSSNSGNSDDSGLTGDEELPFSQDDAAILRSTQYMLTGRAVYDGVATPYKVARSGEKLAMFSEMNGQQIGVIVTEDIVYLLSVDEKTYIEFTKEMLKESMSDEELASLTGSSLDLDKPIKRTMNQSEDGVIYDVVVYEDGSRDYFIGGTIMKTVSPDGSVLYYDSVSAVVPDSVFTPPADYTRTALDEEGVSEFIDVIETTAEHTHADE